MTGPAAPTSVRGDYNPQMFEGNYALSASHTLFGNARTKTDEQGKDGYGFSIKKTEGGQEQKVAIKDANRQIEAAALQHSILAFSQKLGHLKGHEKLQEAAGYLAEIKQSQVNKTESFGGAGGIVSGGTKDAVPLYDAWIQEFFPVLYNSITQTNDQVTGEELDEMYSTLAFLAMKVEDEHPNLEGEAFVTKLQAVVQKWVNDRVADKADGQSAPILAFQNAFTLAAPDALAVEAEKTSASVVPEPPAPPQVKGLDIEGQKALGVRFDEAIEYLKNADAKSAAAGKEADQWFGTPNGANSVDLSGAYADLNDDAVQAFLHADYQNTDVDDDGVEATLLKLEGTVKDIKGKIAAIEKKEAAAAEANKLSNEPVKTKRGFWKILEVIGVAVAKIALTLLETLITVAPVVGRVLLLAATAISFASGLATAFIRLRRENRMLKGKGDYSEAYLQGDDAQAVQSAKTYLDRVGEIEEQIRDLYAQTDKDWNEIKGPIADLRLRLTAIKAARYRYLDEVLENAQTLTKAQKRAYRAEMEAIRGGKNWKTVLARTGLRTLFLGAPLLFGWLRWGAATKKFDPTQVFTSMSQAGASGSGLSRFLARIFGHQRVRFGYNLATIGVPALHIWDLGTSLIPGGRRFSLADGGMPNSVLFFDGGFIKETSDGLGRLFRNMRNRRAHDEFKSESLSRRWIQDEITGKAIEAAKHSMIAEQGDAD